MDETDVKVKGQWRSLSRAVEKHGQTIDFLLTAQRDEEVALRFLKKAMRRHGVPEKITIDGSAANAAAINHDNEAHGTHIVLRRMQYLHKVVEQDQRAVKLVTRPMLGCKSFDAAQATLVDIALMPMIKKRPLRVEAVEERLTAAALFSSLAASASGRRGQLTSSRLHTKIGDRAKVVYTSSRYPAKKSVNGCK